MMRAVILTWVLALLWGSAALAQTSQCTPATGPVVAPSESPRRTLPGKLFRAVILDFANPVDAEVGVALSRILWREVHFATSDIASTALFLAGENDQLKIRTQLGTNSTALLDECFHQAALQIAQLLNSQLAVWGTAISEDNKVTVYPSLSMLPEKWRDTLRIGIGGRLSGLSVQISRPLLNLPSLTLDLNELVKGKATLVCRLKAGCPTGVPTFSEPNDARMEKQGPEDNTVAEIQGIKGKWLSAKLPDGRIRWVNLYHVDLPPREVEVERESTSQYDRVDGRPSPGGIPIARYRVDEMLRGRGENPWYRLQVGDRLVLVKGGDVRPVYRLPFANFIAGLYRYATGQFAKAEDEFLAFNAFLEKTYGEGARNARATTLQFLAAARLQRYLASDGKVGSDALTSLNEALTLTPNDPALHRMRVLASLAISPSNTAAVVGDMLQSILLDPDDSETKTLRNALLAPAEGGTRVLQNLGVEAQKLSDRLKDITATNR